MTTNRSAKLVKNVSRQTRDATSARALSFVRAVARDSLICAALTKAGYTRADSERGWTLLRNVITATTPPVVVEENPVASALDEVGKWSAKAFSVAQAALGRLHPEQETFLFAGLDLGTGSGAVLLVSIFLDRCAQLESGKDRKATRTADLAALATLETRGVTKAERKRLRVLVDFIDTEVAPVAEAPPPPPEARDVFLEELRSWLHDWTTTAKAVITRRDQLLKLGIGKRRPRKAAAPLTPVATPPAPVALGDDEKSPDSRAA